MMKRYFSIISFVTHISVLAQTNTFPASGNVGIGTINPSANLHIGKRETTVVTNEVNIDRVAIQPYYHTGGPWFINSRDNPNKAYLDIKYGASKIYTIDHTGNVGIGTITPSAKLNIDPQGAGGIIIGNPNTLSGGYTSLALKISDNQNGYASVSSIKASGNAYGILALNENGGSVGIGTATPTEKLSVNGKIRAKEIKVENNNWPDYVLEKTYKLPTLQQTEYFIQQNGHLEGVPSAKEVAKNGIELGMNQAALLKKIEEMTLHLIDINKRMEQLEKEIKRLNKL
ncbi:hypothetical protein [Niabella aquatica]